MENKNGKSQWKITMEITNEKKWKIKIDLTNSVCYLKSKEIGKIYGSRTFKIILKVAGLRLLKLEKGAG